MGRNSDTKPIAQLHSLVEKAATVLTRRRNTVYEHRAFFPTMERVESTLARGGERTEKPSGDRQGPVTGAGFAARTFQMGIDYGIRPGIPDPGREAVRRPWLCGRGRRHTSRGCAEPGGCRVGFHPAADAI